jgi:anti-sigma regulatory factor (Ser/Thr protein kinase)
MPEPSVPTVPNHPWRQSIDFEAVPHSASRARTFVCTRARLVGFDAEALGDIEVAVGEAVTNAILYGRPAAPRRGSQVISVAAAWDGHTFLVEVRDPGPGFNPQCRDGAAVMMGGEAIGGRGLPLMHALMDEVRFESDAGGTLVRMFRAPRR